jgi:hypothetical protein
MPTNKGTTTTTKEQLASTLLCFEISLIGDKIKLLRKVV